jgi:hypothetical protein
MSAHLLPAWNNRKAVIGMVHLAALPGAPLHAGDRAAVLKAALRDAKALAEGGVDALMMENFFDVPFYPDNVPPGTIAHMAVIAQEIKRAFALPLGVNVLRNDGLAALAVADAAGADFIRVNILCGARIADQGIIQGRAHEILRERARLGAQGIRILADVSVKHSAPFTAIALADEVEDTVQRALADGLVVSGTGTGKPVDVEHLLAVRAAAGGVPVFVGSGASEKTASILRENADGFIVGTSIKRDGKVGNPVDVERVRGFVAACRG